MPINEGDYVMIQKGADGKNIAIKIGADSTSPADGGYAVLLNTADGKKVIASCKPTTTQDQNCFLVDTADNARSVCTFAGATCLYFTFTGPNIAYIYVNAPLPSPIPDGETHVELDINEVRQWTIENPDYDGYEVYIDGINELDYVHGSSNTIIDNDVKWFGSNNAKIVMIHPTTIEKKFYDWTFGNYDSSYFTFFNNIEFSYTYNNQSYLYGFAGSVSFIQNVNKTSLCNCKITVDLNVKAVNSTPFEGWITQFNIATIATVAGCTISANIKLTGSDGAREDGAGYIAQSAGFFFLSNHNEYYGNTYIQDIDITSGNGVDGTTIVGDFFEVATRGGQVSYSAADAVGLSDRQCSTNIMLTAGSGGNGVTFDGPLYYFGSSGARAGNILCHAEFPELDDIATLVCKAGGRGSGADGASSTGDLAGKGGDSGGNEVRVTFRAYTDARIELIDGLSRKAGDGGDSERGTPTSGSGFEGGDVDPSEWYIAALSKSVTREITVTLIAEMLDGGAGGNGGDTTRAGIYGGFGGNGASLTYTRIIESIAGYLIDPTEIIGAAGAGGEGGTGSLPISNDGEAGTRTITLN